MALTQLCKPPVGVVAGDSLSWSRGFDGYKPADGWALSYTLVGPTTVYSFNARGDGDSFAVAVAASTTAPWAPGKYKLVETLTNAGTSERVTVGTTPFNIAANLAATASTGADTRTHARKVLDAIEAWLESKAPVAGALEINGRKVQYYSVAELLTLRDRYRAEVAREDHAFGGVGSRILVRL